MLVILLADFHVHCWLLLSKRANLKDSTAKKGTSTGNFGGLTPSLPPLLRRACISCCVYSIIVALCVHVQYILRKNKINAISCCIYSIIVSLCVYLKIHTKKESNKCYQLLCLQYYCRSLYRRPSSYPERIK